MRALAATSTWPVAFGRYWFQAALLVPFLLLGFGRLLPATGVGAGVRLAAAAAIVLLVPGAVVVRVLGAPRAVGLAVGAALAWSLVFLFVALVVTFALDGSLTLTLVLVAAGTLATGVWAFSRPTPPIDSADVLASLVTLVVSLPLAAAVWIVHRTVIRDGLFHVAYARKLEELPQLGSLESIGHFEGVGLHPGYAFPLWHGALAAISRLAGVDETEAVLRLNPVLVPLALVIAYGVGVAVFRSVWGGLTTGAAAGALWAFSGTGLGVFMSLSDPATLARGPLILGLFALFFAFMVEGGRCLGVSVLAAALVLAIIHPNYAPYAAVVLLGCLAARLLITREVSPDWVRGALGVGAVLVPSGLFILWLWPVVSETNSFTPDAAGTARDMAHYLGFFVGSEDSFRLDEGAITRRGGLVVGALLAVPLASLAGRRLWAALVLGGALTILGVLLLPFLFTTFADLSSLSQARRLVAFLPLSFALVGAAVVAGRLRLAGVAGALAAGILLVTIYPGESTYRIGQAGPRWPVWIAVTGGLCGLAYAVWRRPQGPDAGRWAAAVATAFVVPFAVAAVPDLEREPRDQFALSSGLKQAVRKAIPPQHVVMSKPETSYRVAAEAPLHVVAVPLAHTTDTTSAQPRRRLADTGRFFAPETSTAERHDILERYNATWLILDKRRFYPPEFWTYVETLAPVYEDGRFLLLRTGAS